MATYSAGLRGPRINIPQKYLFSTCLHHKNISMWIGLVCLAAKAKYHRLGGLNNKHVFLMVLESGKSKIKTQAQSVSGKNLLPDSQMTVFLLCPHMAE